MTYVYTLNTAGLFKVTSAAETSITVQALEGIFFRQKLCNLKRTCLNFYDVYVCAGYVKSVKTQQSLLFLKLRNHSCVAC